MRNLLLHLAVFFSGNFWSLFWIFSFHDKKNVTISHYILEYIVHLCNLRQSAVNLTSPCTRSYKSNRNFAHLHFHHSTDCFSFWFSNFFHVIFYEKYILDSNALLLESNWNLIFQEFFENMMSWFPWIGLILFDSHRMNRSIIKNAFYMFSKFIFCTYLDAFAVQFPFGSLCYGLDHLILHVVA